MPIEYVPVLDENGDDVGGYTESVPDMYVKEEPDCFSCHDVGCPDCDGSAPIDLPQATTKEVDPVSTGWSTVPPF
jgi:hypothetical protein